MRSSPRVTYYHGDTFNTSKRDAFILLPCLGIYKYSIVYKLIAEPLYLLLEDQRSEISCKRNIKATRPSMERLVYYGLLCFLAINSFQTKTCFTKKILPEKKWTVLLESFFYTSEHCDTQSPYTPVKWGKPRAEFISLENFSFPFRLAVYHVTQLLA